MPPACRLEPLAIQSPGRLPTIFSAQQPTPGQRQSASLSIPRFNLNLTMEFNFRFTPILTHILTITLNPALTLGFTPTAATYFTH
jgi:hypothetical protein